MPENNFLESPYASTADTDEISIKQVIYKISKVWLLLRTNWIIILFIGFTGGVIGFIYAWKQPLVYVANLTFVVEEGKTGVSGLGGLASIAGQFGVDVSGSSGGSVLSGDNILLYFKSASLTREVLLSKYDENTSKTLADAYAEVYHLKDSWRKNKEIGDVVFPPLTKNVIYSRLQDSLLQVIIFNINKLHFSISRVDKKAGFIEVKTVMANESLAKIYCERIVRVASDKFISVKTQRQKNTVEKLQARADSVARLLNQKTASSATLQTSTNTMDINPLFRTNTLVATETTLRDKALLSTIFASVTQNLELAKFTLNQETPVIQIVDSPYYPLKREKMSRLKAAIIFSMIFGVVVVVFLISKNMLATILRN